MAKVQTSIRLEPEEIAAVKRAAADDRRPMAAMLRLLITEALAERGYLADGVAVGEAAPARRTRRSSP